MGTYRLFLSLVVVHLHFSWGPLLGGVAAVYGFFMLSGYLMLLVYERTYSRVGVVAFYSNRLLRIMPLYWVYLGLMVAFMSLFGQPIKANLLSEMFFSPFGRSELMPHTWSLKVEILFYTLVPVLTWLGRKSRAWIWGLLCVTAAYGAITYGFGLSFSVYRYGNIIGTLPLFLVGMLTYHYRALLPKLSGWWLVSGMVIFYIYFWRVLDRATEENIMAYEPTLIASFGLLWILLVASIHFKPAGKLKTFDLWCGRLSYGVFINHFLAAVILRGLEMSVTNAVYLSLILAPATWWFLERPIDKTREAIKAPAKSPVSATSYG